MAKEVVIVTGSSGLIGFPLCERLCGRYAVVAFDRKGPPYPPAAVHTIDVDLTSDRNVRKAFDEIRQRYGRRLAAVVHLAAYYDFSGAPSPKYDLITLGGTQRLLRELQDFDCEQFIFSSTMLVHAPTEPGRRINEDSPLAATWPYPESKIKTEKAIREMRGEIPAMMLRIGGVYADACHSIPLARQIQRIYERQLTSHFFPGDLSAGQSFVHLDDVLRCIELAVDNRRKMPREAAVLVGEPKSVPYGELQWRLGQLLYGRPWKTYRIPKWTAKAGAWMMSLSGQSFIKPWMIDRADDHYELDITRARAWLGWEPKRSLVSTLPLMTAELKRRPGWWYRVHDLKPPRWIEPYEHRHAPPEPHRPERRRELALR